MISRRSPNTSCVWPTKPAHPPLVHSLLHGDMFQIKKKERGRSFRSLLSQGNLDQICHLLSAKTTLKCLTTTGCSNNWLFTPNTLFRIRMLKISTHVRFWQYPRVLPSPWNDDHRIRRKSYSYAYLEDISFSQSYQASIKWWSFPPSTWETWFFSSLGVQIPALLGPSQQCVCLFFRYDSYGDHVQTCQTQSETLPSHDWVVYKLEGLCCFAKAPRTGQPSSSSSNIDNGLHNDTRQVWTITLAPYWTAHTHQAFSWCSSTRLRSGPNLALSEDLLGSLRTNCLPDVITAGGIWSVSISSDCMLS